jgi:hypothetical protein
MGRDLFGACDEATGRGKAKAAAVGLLVLLGLSCGDSGGGAGSAESFIASYCDVFATNCCAKADLRTDGLQCRAFFGAFVSTAQYDKQKGEACLAAVREAAGKSDFCTTSSNPSPLVCESVFGMSTGTKKPGEACEEDDDCAASSEGEVECVSSFNAGAEVRKCQVRVRGKAGDQPCVGDVDGGTTISNSVTEIPTKGFLCHAQDGLRCDATTDSCTTFKAVGEACSSTSSFRRECVAEAYCDTTQRKCVPRKAVGVACTNTGLSQNECVDAAYCGDAKQCIAQLTDGVACTSNRQCRSDNCLNSVCRPSTTSDFGLALLCGAK